MGTQIKSHLSSKYSTPEEWLEAAFEDGHIKHFNYSNFTNFEYIGEGGFGEVKRATYQIAHTTPMIFALKIIKKLVYDNKDNNKALLDFIKEVTFYYDKNQINFFNY